MKNREFRFDSPTIYLIEGDDGSVEFHTLLNVALTNIPSRINSTALVAARETEMNKKNEADKAKEVKAGASSAQPLEVVPALPKKEDAKEIVALEEEVHQAKKEEPVTAAEEVKTPQMTPEEMAAAIEALQSQNAELESQIAQKDKEIEDLKSQLPKEATSEEIANDLIAAHKLDASLKDWALALDKKQLQAFAKVVKPREVIKQKQSTSFGTDVSESARKVFKMMNVDPAKVASNK